MANRSDDMVTQKPISARISHETLWEIEQEIMLGETTRNKILNDGARLWLDLRDTRRRIRAHGDTSIKRKIIRGFIAKWMPEAAGL